MKKKLPFVITIFLIGINNGIYSESIDFKNIQNITSGFDFDIIYVNEIDVTLPEGGGITTSANTVALLVNTGSEPITKEDCENATISVTSDCKNASFDIDFNTANEGRYPIYPNQAWGSVGEKNKFLLDFIKEGEELINYSPSQTFYDQIERENFIGIAIFNISLKMRKVTAHLQVKINYSDGGHNLSYLSGERVKGIKTLYVGGFGDDNYTKIQDAIDNASDGDTVFVYDDSSPYKENIIIDKSLMMVGENRNKTVISSDNISDAVNITGANVILLGFTIQTADDSVSYLKLNAENIQIEYNRFVNITMLSKNNNGISITNNIFPNDKWIKRRIIYLINGNSCLIKNNTVSRSNSGIGIYNCQDSRICFNTVHNCFSGISDISGSSNVINNNTVDVADNGVYHNGNNVLIENNTIFDCNNGIELYYTSYAHISQNDLFNNLLSIVMHRAFFTNIESNNIRHFVFRNTVVTNSFFNRWNKNYWGRPILLPKIIIVYYGIYNVYEPIDLPWINFDWHPAKEPYDI